MEDSDDSESAIETPRTMDDAINGLCQYIREETTKSERTEHYYHEQCHSVAKILMERDSEILPQTVTKKDVVWLLEEMEKRGYTVKSRKGYVQALRTITLHYGNPSVKNMEIRWQHDTRPNVDWLSIEQARILNDCPKTAIEELVIHLGLCLGFRRVEIARAKTDDFHFGSKVSEGYVDVLGKGSMGGKPRRISAHRDTQRVLERYYAEHRTKVISNACKKNPYVEIPKNVLIAHTSGKLKPFSTKKLSGIDKIILGVSKRVGFHFSSHTLRRTYGRLLYRSGVDVAIVSKFLGHERSEDTLQYIGVDLDDMSKAMEKFPL